MNWEGCGTKLSAAVASFGTVPRNSAAATKYNHDTPQ